MSGLCPPVILLVLGILLTRTIRNTMGRQVAPVNDNSNNRRILKQIDAQLSIMILMQTLTAIPSFIPYGSQLLYANITQYSYKTPLRIAVESVVTEIIHLLSYFFFGARYTT